MSTVKFMRARSASFREEIGACFPPDTKLFFSIFEGGRGPPITRTGCMPQGGLFWFGFGFGTFFGFGSGSGFGIRFGFGVGFGDFNPFRPLLFLFATFFYHISAAFGGRKKN